MRGTTALLQQVEGLPEWREVELGGTLVGAMPSAQGCSYISEEGVVTWVGLDGALHPLFDPAMPVPGSDLGGGLSLVLTDPPSLITNEHGLLQLSVSAGFELPESVALALPRGDYLHLAGAKIISDEPYVTVPVHADVDLTTGQVHPRDMQGVLLGHEQPGNGRWLGATDRVSWLATVSTTPYAVDVVTGERRALSSAPVPLPTYSGLESLDSVITVGDRAVYFEQVFDGEEVVELRPVIIDL